MYLQYSLWWTERRNVCHVRSSQWCSINFGGLRGETCVTLGAVSGAA